MTKKRRLLEDAERLALAAFASAAKAKRRATDYIRKLSDSLSAKMNFATKDELNAIQDIISHAKQDIQDIKSILSMEFGMSEPKQEHTDQSQANTSKKTIRVRKKTTKVYKSNAKSNEANKLEPSKKKSKQKKKLMLDA